MTDRLVFFDLETGGLEPGRHPIIQFAGVAVDAKSFEELDALEVKIHFDPDACEPDALRLNSFNADTWQREAVLPGEAETRISSFLKRHATVEMVSRKGKPYRVAQLVGHNAASFDFPFLSAWYRARDAFLSASFSVLDTLQLARWHFLHTSGAAPKSMRLGDLCEFFDIPAVEAHDALSDVRATAQVCRQLLARFVSPRALTQAEAGLPRHPEVSA